MPSFSTCVSWATPVKIEHLGPHVEAYMNLLPTINAIRLCHRHGGTDAPITRLPVELVLCIEDFLISTERSKSRKAWRQDYECFHETCVPHQHFNKNEVNHWRRMLRLGAVDQDPSMASAPEIGQINVAIMDHDHQRWMDRHLEHKCSWRDRYLGLGTGANQTAFLKHFGLDIWTSSVRLAESGESDYDADETTLAYLILPGASRASHEAGLSDNERDMRYHMIETGSATELIRNPSLPDGSKEKFKRTMKILGLRPYEHESQKGNVMGPNSISEKQRRKSNKPRKKWPRLTLLVSSLTCSND